MDIIALLHIRNIKPSGIWKQMMWELYTGLLLVYCTLLFFWFISCSRKITRSFAHSQKLVYLIILNNESMVYFAWKVCYLSLKVSVPIGLKICNDIIHFEMCPNIFAVTTQRNMNANPWKHPSICSYLEKRQ